MEFRFCCHTCDITTVTQDLSGSKERGRAVGWAPTPPSSAGAVARIQNTEISRKKASTGHLQDKIPESYSLPRKSHIFLDTAA